ncbi:MAG: hypothetical protein MP439_03135 [Ferrimicrobium sp.]|nr:hypothetical protein [Ferrimicrobium sp.]
MRVVQTYHVADSRHADALHAAELGYVVHRYVRGRRIQEGISAVELARKIDVRYTTAWYVLCRLRLAMSQCEEQYLLIGEVDVDDMFVGGVSPQTAGALNPQDPLSHRGES